MDRKRQRIINFILTIIVVLICTFVIIFSFAIKAQMEEKYAQNNGTTTTPDSPSQPTEKPTSPDTNEIVEAKFIDLQPTLEQWLRTLPRTTAVGVMVYDLNNSQAAASHNADQVFNVASIYKLFFAYDGYRQISLGAESADQFLLHTEDKGDLTLSRCLDLIIRESYNPCADYLSNDNRRVGRVNSLIRELEMANTDNIGLESTAADLTKLLRRYWQHYDLKSDQWSQLADSMLNQPPSQTNEHPLYDWRQGLPAGFSNHVQVYNKVGWDWNGESWTTYADAAILEFVDYKHYYTVVVLTSNLADYHQISQLGQMIEDIVVSRSDGIIK